MEIPENCQITLIDDSYSSSFRWNLFQEAKNSLKIKFLGRIFLGHQGPRCRDIPDKNFMQVALCCCFRQGVEGMSRDWGGTSRICQKLYARKLWAVLSVSHYRCRMRPFSMPNIRVHAKGVVLCERACFCLLSAF